MASAENSAEIYRNDLVDGLVKDTNFRSVVDLVEGFVRRGNYFVLSQKTTGDLTDRNALITDLRDPKPLVAYWRGAHLPLLSDPEQRMEGAIAIDTNSKEPNLIYSPGAVALHDMRDGFRIYGTLSSYYVGQNCYETVEEFLGRGYLLKASSFLTVDTKGITPSVQGDITIDDLRF